jgi:hypothetical protein
MYNNIKNGRYKSFSNFKNKYLKDPIYFNNCMDPDHDFWPDQHKTNTTRKTTCGVAAELSSPGTSHHSKTKSK